MNFWEFLDKNIFDDGFAFFIIMILLIFALFGPIFITFNKE